MIRNRSSIHAIYKLGGNSYVCLSRYKDQMSQEAAQQSSQPDPEILLSLVSMKMPFGKYKNTLLCDLPVSYLEWFHREGFPKGRLGVLLATIYEIKINGLSGLLEPLKKI